MKFEVLSVTPSQVIVQPKEELEVKVWGLFRDSVLDAVRELAGVDQAYNYDGAIWIFHRTAFSEYQVQAIQYICEGVVESIKTVKW